MRNLILYGSACFVLRPIYCQQSLIKKGETSAYKKQFFQLYKYALKYGIGR